MRGEMVDLSPNGARLMTDRELTPGTIIRIECSLLSAVGRVRSSTLTVSESRLRMQTGIEFMTLKFAAAQGSFVSVSA